MSEYIDVPALIERAKEMYEDDDIAIDTDARISVTDDGVWVQAWVWVPDAPAHTESDGNSDSTEDSKRHGGAW